MSCGYPSLRLDAKVGVDTVGGGTEFVKFPVLMSALELNATLTARLEELKAAYETSHASRMHAEDCVRRLEAENAKLRKCVAAADSEIEAWREWGARIGDDERVCGWVHQEDYGLYCLLADPPVSDIPYDRARAEVDK